MTIHSGALPCVKAILFYTCRLNRHTTTLKRVHGSKGYKSLAQVYYCGILAVVSQETCPVLPLLTLPELASIGIPHCVSADRAETILLIC
jgi:hypothetical protein